MRGTFKQGLTLTQSNSLAETNEEPSGHKAGEIALVGKGLHHGSSNGDQAAQTHASATPQKVGLDVKGQSPGSEWHERSWQYLQSDHQRTSQR